MKQIMKSKKGITLISLVVTIIILLILAGISIGMLSGDNSILRQAGNAKTQTDIAQEKEILQIATLAAIGKHKYGDVTKEKLDNELDKNIGSTNYSSESVNNGISVTFTKSGRIYIVDKDGNIEQVPEAIGIASLSAEKTSISVGETTQLSAILEPTKSFGKITYSSADTSIATVSSSGLVTGIANGTVVITANVKGEEKNITIIVEKKLTAAELNGDLLGKEVDYSGYTASYSGGWRVFYATDEETFIITTSYIDATNAFGESGHIPLESKSGVIYTGSFDVANSEYGKNWNKMWVIDQINQTTDKVNNENPESVQGQHRHKATAYLCDTANWTDYVTPNANYAVGGPTVELFVKSWENRPGGSSIQITGITNYGYPSVINSGIQETILQKNGVGLYNIGTNYWIASPISNDESRFSSYMSVCEKAGRFNGYNNNSSSCVVRPIVSIPTSKLRENSDGTKLVILP